MATLNNGGNMVTLTAMEARYELAKASGWIIDIRDRSRVVLRRGGWSRLFPSVLAALDYAESMPGARNE